MATNSPKGDGHRNGAVRKRSQFLHPNGNHIKRDTTTGQFIEQKVTDGKFKGVRIEKPTQ